MRRMIVTIKNNLVESTLKNFQLTYSYSETLLSGVFFLIKNFIIQIISIIKRNNVVIKVKIKNIKNLISNSILLFL